jgi:hypothetical protein
MPSQQLAVLVAHIPQNSMCKTNLVLRDNSNNSIGLSRSSGFLALAVDNIGLRDINLIGRLIRDQGGSANSS